METTRLACLVVLLVRLVRIEVFPERDGNSPRVVPLGDYFNDVRIEVFPERDGNHLLNVDRRPQLLLRPNRGLP